MVYVYNIVYGRHIVTYVYRIQVIPVYRYYNIMMHFIKRIGAVSQSMFVILLGR